MSRFSVVGTSGAGKTQLASAIADRLDIPHVELDALYHQPDWGEPAPEAFRADVIEALAGDAWVACGNYSAVRPTVWGRATHVVWLDYPRGVVMRRVVRRTVRRVVRREQLWNGNREPWRNLWDPRPRHNIIVWSWTNHEKYRRRYASAMDDRTWAHLSFVQLRSPAEAEAWIADLVPDRPVG
ncbi:MAG: shikimate kinase [Acidimicrobiia bacterium]